MLFFSPYGMLVALIVQFVPAILVAIRRLSLFSHETSFSNVLHETATANKRHIRLLIILFIFIPISNVSAHPPSSPYAGR